MFITPLILYEARCLFQKNFALLAANFPPPVCVLELIGEEIRSVRLHFPAKLFCLAGPQQGPDFACSIRHCMQIWGFRFARNTFAAIENHASLGHQADLSIRLRGHL